MITTNLILMLAIISLIVLGAAYFKLHRKHQLLKANVDSINRDLAGLCAAANNVDSRISVNKDILQILMQERNVLAHNDSEATELNYQDIIEKVKKGMNSTELARQCGVSFDEAALLVRLYGTVD